MNIVKQIQTMQTDINHIRNISICAHIDHGKTTVSDTLLIGSKLLSQENQQVLDNKPEEISRGITIDASVTSTVQYVQDMPYILNIVDTPGHIDFNWQVEQSFSMVQGSIIVVDIVEGIQAQTTALSKIIAQKNIQPILFINKLDKLFATHTPQQILTKIAGIIQTLQPIFGEKIHIQNGTVCFGCAKDNWGIHAPSMKQTQFTLATVIEYYAEKKQDQLKQKIPLYSCLAQAVFANVNAPKPLTDKTIVYLSDELHQKIYHICQVGTQNFSAQPYLKIANTYHAIAELYPGMIGATTVQCEIGSELSANGERVFQRQIQTTPTISASVDVIHIQDSPHLKEALDYAHKTDPSITYTISPQSGEYIVQGQGELQLQICLERIAQAIRIQLQLKELQVITQTHLKPVQKTYDHATLTISPSQTLEIHSQYEPLIRQMLQTPYTQYCANIQTTGTIANIQQELFKILQPQTIAQPYIKLRVYVGHESLKTVQQVFAQRKAIITAIQYDAQVCTVECTLLLKDSVGLYTQIKKITSGNSTIQHILQYYE
jgi:small GTP-binding protein